VLELHAIAAKKAEGGAEFAVAMTTGERARFLHDIRREKEYLKMLGTVNAERSECSRSADLESIHAGIRDSIGFAKLNRMLFGVMEEWIDGQLRTELAASLERGDESEVTLWSATLKNVLIQQGKHQDALVFQQQLLDSDRRMFPEGHPMIGECVRCIVVSIVTIATTWIEFDV
jgi:hypothetical protein